MNESTDSNERNRAGKKENPIPHLSDNNWNKEYHQKENDDKQNAHLKIETQISFLKKFVPQKKTDNNQKKWPACRKHRASHIKNGKT